MITVAQYQKILPSISKTRRNILLKLYAKGPFPDSTIIAAALGYERFTAVNMQIGTIGRIIGEQLNVVPKENYTYKGRERPAYFLFVHQYTDEGWDLNQRLQKAMENLGWTKELTADDYERLETEEKGIDRSWFRDGKLIHIAVNRYERDRKAREQCLKLHGRKCKGCQLDFKSTYGQDIKNIIHVHHTKQLSTFGKEIKKDVTKDLVPLCPYCHAVVHSTKKLMRIEDLQRRIQSNRNKK